MWRASIRSLPGEPKIQPRPPRLPLFRIPPRPPRSCRRNRAALPLPFLPSCSLRTWSIRACRVTQPSFARDVAAQVQLHIGAVDVIDGVIPGLMAICENRPIQTQVSNTRPTGIP